MRIDKQLFKTPGRRGAIRPIVHQGIVGAAAEAERYAQAGFAGVVGNVPYTESFPRDEKAWADFEKAARTFIGRGLETWIYDEKGYPSGTAGGAVIDENPDFTAEGLYCYEYWRTLTGPGPYRADTPGDRLFRALLLPLAGGEPVDVTAAADERGTLHLQVPAGSWHLFMLSSRRLFDGTHAAESYSEPRNYICLADKAAAEAFARITYDGYAARLGDEFGRGVPAFFTDEPSLIAWNIRQAVYPIVPWHRTWPEKFAARYGYPIELAVTAVVTKRGEALIKRRCDFWGFVADEVADGYFGTLQAWCRRHGVKFSGHLLEEERLTAHVINYGSYYRSIARLDWPGIDQLDSEPQKLMARDKLPIARLAASAADISGERESFTEFSDHTSRAENKQIGIEWIYASVNWHHAMGINNFTSYYDFSPFSAAQLQALNAYTARLGYLLRLGRRDSRTALLYPEATVWAAYTPTVAERARDFSPDTLKVENALRDLSWQLLERQADFDYIDERLLCAGEIQNGRLCFGDRAYSTVVLPAVRVLGRRSLQKLLELLGHGVGVVFAGEVPSVESETGEPCDFPAQLPRFYGAKNCSVLERAALPGAARIPALERPMRLEPASLETVLTGADGAGPVADGEVLSPDILSHLRDAGDTKILFLTNMGGRTWRGSAALAFRGHVERADPASGGIEPQPAEQEGGVCRIPLELRPYQGLCFILYEN